MPVQLDGLKIVRIPEQLLIMAAAQPDPAITMLVNYLFRISANIYPLPVKFARSLACAISFQRCVVF
jgi:hypothetical protein